MEDVEKLKEELEKNAIKVTSVNVLFLDLSSNCTGYALANVDFEKKSANFLNSGAIWFDKNWNNQDKYHYIFCAITNYFNIVGKVDFCIAEAYMLNTKRVMGCHVGPEMHGALQVALAEVGTKYSTIPVQTWRKHLGIKRDETGDFKEPTKQKVLEYVSLPDEIVSNVTKTSRKLPYDLTDAIAIGLGALKKLGIENFNFKNMTIQESIDI